ncbi:hypothetical protein BpHYR1_022429 [Brachionus plicatilis]|uniref:Uncharacterized protein n=1 Tax=Brachionus plicatilis TaxID=10195 RepID=A0A3M7RES8_BRAPC|nr:hypothetical protein BpHYR1_022429 [Brachionus plicatilis]
MISDFILVEKRSIINKTTNFTFSLITFIKIRSSIDKRKSALSITKLTNFLESKYPTLKSLSSLTIVFSSYRLSPRQTFKSCNLII